MLTQTLSGVCLSANAEAMSMLSVRDGHRHGEIGAGRGRGVVIRAMVCTDIPMVIGFMRPIRETSFLEWENAELLAAHLEREASNFVAVQAGGIVGAIIAGSVGVRGAISHVAVVESHRRQGVAGALVDKVLADFRTRGIRRVFLFAETGNDPARRLWAYCGFSETHNEVTWECDL